jgi:nitrate reductase NapE component
VSLKENEMKTIIAFLVLLPIVFGVMFYVGFVLIIWLFEIIIDFINDKEYN